MEIEKISKFKELENRFVVCSDVLFEIEGQPKKARFFIAGSELSALLTREKFPQVYESIRDKIENDLNPKWEFNDTFFYTFTGSHFQQDDEKPKWAEDNYRS